MSPSTAKPSFLQKTQNPGPAISVAGAYSFLKLCQSLRLTTIGLVQRSVKPQSQVWKDENHLKHCDKPNHKASDCETEDPEKAITITKRRRKRTESRRIAIRRRRKTKNTRKDDYTFKVETKNALKTFYMNHLKEEIKYDDVSIGDDGVKLARCDSDFKKLAPKSKRRKIKVIYMRL